MSKTPTSEAAIKHFEHKGGDRLARVEVCRTDPLKALPHLKILRNQRYCERLPVIKVFSSLGHVFLKYVKKRLYLMVVSTTFLLVCFVNLKESTFEKRKLFFYFTWKALFVLEIIKF